MDKPRPMTRDNLASAFSGEAMAHIRYMLFAEIAEKEGSPNVARFFRAVASPRRCMPATITRS